MKHKKTFWRGFGAGVLFAAVILGISCLLRTSDAQVVARAKKLGMVYETSDSNALALKSKDQEQKATKEPEQTDAAATQKPVQSIEPAASEDPSKVPTPEPLGDSGNDTQNKKASTKKSIDNDKTMQNEKKKMEKEVKSSAKKLKIVSGDMSQTVSKKLERLGIIDDAESFDNYMNRNGYSQNITVGSFSISPDDTYRDIAKKITK